MKSEILCPEAPTDPVEISGINNFAILRVLLGFDRSGLQSNCKGKIDKKT